MGHTRFGFCFFDFLSNGQSNAFFVERRPLFCFVCKHTRANAVFIGLVFHCEVNK